MHSRVSRCGVSLVITLLFFELSRPWRASASHTSRSSHTLFVSTERCRTILSFSRFSNTLYNNVVHDYHRGVYNDSVRIYPSCCRCPIPPLLQRTVDTVHILPIVILYSNPHMIWLNLILYVIMAADEYSSSFTIRSTLLFAGEYPYTVHTLLCHYLRYNAVVLTWKGENCDDHHHCAAAALLIGIFLPPAKHQQCSTVL